MSHNIIRISFLLLALIFFISYKYLRNNEMTFKFSSRYGVSYNEKRMEYGSCLLTDNYTSDYAPTEDGIELVYSNTKKEIHKEKHIFIKPSFVFWKPRLQEEIDLYEIPLDSLHIIKLNAIYVHHYDNGEDPWGLSFYEMTKDNKTVKSQQINKVQIDSILNIKVIK